MANNVINTRIQLKVDTLTNWQTNNPVLLDGEIAIAKIDIVDPANKHLQPAMIKVGDGTSTFNQLDWTSAKAADVYEWAKASTKPEYNFEELKNIPDFITPDELENYYTKDEINTKLSSVYRFKGNVQTLADLPTENNTPGDVYNIEEDSSLTMTVETEMLNVRVVTFGLKSNDGETYWLVARDVKTKQQVSTISGTATCWGKTVATEPFIWTESQTFPVGDPLYDLTLNDNEYYIQSDDQGWDDGYNDSYIISSEKEITVKAGDNVAWTGTEWDVLAGTFEIDLSNYVTNDNVVNSINGKKGDITLTTQDLYNGFTVDENGIQYSGNWTYDFSINDGFTFKSINTLTPSIVVDYRGFAVTCDDPAGAADIIVKQNNYIDVTNLELGTYYTTHRLTEKANTADLATIATSGNIYDISNAGAVQTSAGTDDTGEKYIVFNCGSSTTVI